MLAFWSWLRTLLAADIRILLSITIFYSHYWYIIPMNSSSAKNYLLRYTNQLIVIYISQIHLWSSLSQMFYKIFSSILFWITLIDIITFNAHIFLLFISVPIFAIWSMLFSTICKTNPINSKLSNCLNYIFSKLYINCYKTQNSSQTNF